MKIIVPVKQVPEVAEVKVDPATGTLIREGVPSILNPFDEYAVEAAIQLKEKYGGEVTIITMGPPQAKDALYKALAMGGDSAIHLTDRVFAGADTWATAFTLSEQIKKMEYDLVICGKQAIDGKGAWAANVPIRAVAAARRMCGQALGRHGSHATVASRSSATRRR